MTIEIIEFIKKDIAERKLNQSDYAVLINVDKALLSRVLRGLQEPTSEFKVRLLEHLKDKQLEVAYLISKKTAR
jgi:transcriptional regulator with XRE-family HTH domain